MTDTTTRCPRCSALLAPEATWCSLCFLDLRPAPEPEPVPEPVSVDEPEPPLAAAVTELPVAAVEGTAAAGDLQRRPGRRYRPSGSAAPAEPAELSEDEEPLPPGVEAMLAQLAVEEGGGRVSLGPLDDAFSTPGRRAGVMAAGALTVTLALFLVMWVLGKLLG